MFDVFNMRSILDNRLADKAEQEESVKNKFFTSLAWQGVANIVPAQCEYNSHESLQVTERKELKFLGY